MKINLKIISLILMVFLISISIVSAEETDDMAIGTDNDIILSDNGVTTDNSKTFNDLQSEINKLNDGDTLVLENDYIGEKSNTESGGIGIYKTITIDGNGKTLDASKSGRIFTINKGADNVVLKNTILTNGFKSDGAGAITVKGINFMIDNCTFISNSANGIAGAVYISPDADQCTIKNCNFTGNTVTESDIGKGSGGAIRCDANNLVLSNNTFSKNSATALGGAISATGNDIRITDNLFENNVAKNESGAIHIGGKSATSPEINPVVSNNRFINNTGPIAGALTFYYCENITVSGNTFNKNHAESLGGAVRITGGKNTGIVDNNTFEDNYANETGAIYVFGDKTVITNNKFNNNKATSGKAGALYTTGLDNIISNNIFDNNTATKDAGAIYAQKDNTKIINNTIKNSKAGENGAAIKIDGDYVIIDKNTIKNNTALGSVTNELGCGGAINVNGANGKIINNEITDNTANNRGGAIYIKGNNVEISGNSFINNSALAKYGGSMEVHGDEAIIKNNIIDKSYSKGDGAGIYIAGNKAQIMGNNITNSVSEGNGGAIFIYEGTEITISKNRIINNKASAYAGGIRLKGDGTISENFLQGNSAKDSSALYIMGGTTTITKNTFVDIKEKDGSIKLYGNATMKSDNTYTSSQNPSPSQNPTQTPIATTLTVPVKSYAVTSSSKILTATLKDADGNPISGKDITFVVNKISYTAQTVNGVASVKVKLTTATSYPVTVKFNGDSTYKGCEGTSTVKVTKVTTKLTTPKKTFKKSLKTKKVTITLKTSSGKVLKNKKITLKVNKKTFKGTTNKKGQAIITVKLTKKGTYKYTAKFAGDKQYKTISKTGKIIIK